MFVLSREIAGKGEIVDFTGIDGMQEQTTDASSGLSYACGVRRANPLFKPSPELFGALAENGNTA